ncbi:MAG: dipeptidase PepE [Candidatus Thermoplasmatota archaeon]|nr:dipeptidase PepE [Candidatus Thermoplasmatota archaeon]MBU1941179.1 dipeptidase PepE [Candidatus Thermoplasmatota archaeon]
MTRNCLLISNSTLHRSGYLDHCANEIKHFLGTKKTIVFIPYARPSGITYDTYADIAQKRFKKMGIHLTGIQTYNNPQDAIKNAEALFIGGGNTFVLLTKLYEANILATIRTKVSEGMPYIGTSAGSNVACKTIKTTNDMPIMYPPSYEALHLVPFNINPHYLDPDPHSTYKGETRETRIKEFHIYNNEYVVGLREGAMLHIIEDTVTLKGTTGARIFKDDIKPQEYPPGESLNFLMKKNNTLSQKNP